MDRNFVVVIVIFVVPLVVPLSILMSFFLSSRAETERDIFKSCVEARGCLTFDTRSGKYLCEDLKK